MLRGKDKKRNNSKLILCWLCAPKQQYIDLAKKKKQIYWCSFEATPKTLTNLNLQVSTTRERVKRKTKERDKVTILESGLHYDVMIQQYVQYIFSS